MLFDALKLLLQLFTVLDQRYAALFTRDEMPLESATAFAATSTTTAASALSTMLLSALVMAALMMA